MKTTTITALVLLGGMATIPLPANAQPLEPPQAFVNANAVGQLNSRAISSTSSFEVYDETATVSSTTDVSAGVLFDVSAGYRVFGDVALALGVSRFTSSGDADITAVIPHPAFTDEPRTINLVAPGLDRAETGIHIQAVWFVTVPDFLPDEIRVALVGGPSIFRLKQQLVTSAAVPAGTQDAVPVLETQTATGVGFNAGIDVSYPLTSLYGVGAFLRYAGATVDLDAAPDKKVGGLQVGAGVRLTF